MPCSGCRRSLQAIAATRCGDAAIKRGLLASSIATRRRRSGGTGLPDAVGRPHFHEGRYASAEPLVFLTRSPPPHERCGHVTSTSRSSGLLDLILTTRFEDLLRRGGGGDGLLPRPRRRRCAGLWLRASGAADAARRWGSAAPRARRSGNPGLRARAGRALVNCYIATPSSTTASTSRCGPADGAHRRRNARQADDCARAAPRAVAEPLLGSSSRSMSRARRGGDAQRDVLLPPATTGVFSGLAALAVLDPLPRDNCASLRHRLLAGCGPIQAHEEGSMMLAMQMVRGAQRAAVARHGRVGNTAPVECSAVASAFFPQLRGGHARPGTARREAVKVPTLASRSRRPGHHGSSMRLPLR